MEREFWLGKWERGELGFHQAEGNPLLKAHVNRLNLSPGDRIFLPLCGKTGDIPWLLSCGYRVVGCELSERAVTDLFQELGVDATRTNEGKLTRYSGDGIDILVGDFFELDQADLGTVEAVYDRAALVALADSQRPNYTAHLAEITQRAPVLLICFEYDQSRMTGPPFAIHEDDVHALYDAWFQPTLIERMAMPRGLKRDVAANETVWLLRSSDANP